MSTATLPACPSNRGLLPRDFALTTVLALLACLASTSATGPWLEFDRLAVLAGQWWRLATGHLVHYNPQHLFWDVLMFFALGAVCERESRGRYVACLVASAAAITAAVWWWLPKLTHYRGLSGIDTALFVLVAMLWLRAAWHRGDQVLLAAIGCGLLALVGKLGYELLTGDTLFVDSRSAGFTPIVLVHVVGAVVGAACGLVVCRAESSVATMATADRPVRAVRVSPDPARNLDR